MSSYISGVGEGISGASSAVTSVQSAKQTRKAGKREMWRIGEALKNEIYDIEQAEAEHISTQKAQVGASGITSEGSPTESMIKTSVKAARAINIATFWATQKQYEIRRGYKLARKAAKYSSISQSFSSGFASSGSAAKGWEQSQGGQSSILGGNYANEWGGGAGSGDYSSWAA